MPTQSNPTTSSVPTSQHTKKLVVGCPNVSRLEVSGQLQSVLTRVLERKARGKERDEVRFLAVDL